MDASALRKKALLLFMAAFAALCSMFFLPAGTLDYWQAWVYLAIVLVPAAFVISYFLKNDPEFLERRLKTKEKEKEQALVQKFGLIIFLIGFLIPGLDRRFGWSDVPFGFVLAADAIVFLGYALIFLVFKENSYAGRTVRIEKGQKVVSTGLYSIIRHPMYFGTLIMYLASPVALGSYVALPVLALCVPMLVFRILNEEDMLRRELPGYREYCKKVKYRLVPLVW